MSTEYSPQACLAFDLGCVGFARRWQRVRNETIWRDETPEEARERQRASKRHQIEVSKYSESELQQFLGIDPNDERAVEMVRDLTEFEAAELDALDWGDEGEAMAGEVTN
jgi:hypothetical protein